MSYRKPKSKNDDADAKYSVAVHEMTYAALVIPVYFLMSPIAILQSMYAKHFGLTLSSIATVILVARLFDAVSDPLVGYFSDKYYLRWNTRKPLIIFGSVLFVISAWKLYVPHGLGGQPPYAAVGTLYFLGWFIAFFFSYTLMVVPHYAWGGELVTNTIERNRLYSLRTSASFMGALFFILIPMLPIFETNEFTPETLRIAVIIVAFLLLPILYLAMRYVPNGTEMYLNDTQKNTHFKKFTSSQMIKCLLSNTPFILLLMALLSVGLSAGIWYALVYLFVDGYLVMGELFSLLFAASYVVGIVSLKCWHYLANNLGKQVTWSIGMSLFAIGLFINGFLSPTDTGWVALLTSMLLVSAGLAAFQAMVLSLVADISDYGALMNENFQPAVYFSCYAFIYKLAIAAGGAAGFMIVDLYGFNPAVSMQSSSGIFGLRLALTWVPLTFALIAIVLILKVPITSRQHAIIRRRLKLRTLT